MYTVLKLGKNGTGKNMSRKKELRTNITGIPLQLPLEKIYSQIYSQSQYQVI